jgi:hypothetical protein
MGDWKGMGVLLVLMVVAVVIGMAVFLSFGLDEKVTAAKDTGASA